MSAEFIAVKTFVLPNADWFDYFGVTGSTVVFALRVADESLGQRSDEWRCRALSPRGPLHRNRKGSSTLLRTLGNASALGGTCLLIAWSRRRAESQEVPLQTERRSLAMTEKSSRDDERHYHMIQRLRELLHKWPAWGKVERADAVVQLRNEGLSLRRDPERKLRRIH